MLTAMINLSLGHRFLVIIILLVFTVFGVLALLRLPIYAFPDTTPLQVLINCVAPSSGPLEIEQQITVPAEQAISGLPGLESVGSISTCGLSQITVVFNDQTDIYFARRLINERLQGVELPDAIMRPELGPAATGLREIYHYMVVG